MLLEIAIDSLPDALAAVGSGADRLEVCDRLDQGGLTPPVELVRALAQQTSVPLFVMIRPRAGDFRYTHEERAAMERQIFEAQRAGAHGIVLGLLADALHMDFEHTEALVRHAAPLSVTVHRAFDRCQDLERTAERLADIGVRRILTSGGRASAEEGMDTLRELHRRVGNRIGVLPGGGVRPANIRRLMDHIGVNEMHSAARDANGRFDALLVREMKRAAGGA